jgi:predicted acetyltransferase
MAAVDLRSIDDPSGDELEAYYRVDDAAFGQPHDPAHVAAKRPLVTPGRFLVASVDGVDVGAAGSFPFDLTLPGGATVPVAGVSDVGVSPTHRRRGVLRALLHRVLDDATDRGEPAAVLNASEAVIYGRFGFGVATRWRRVQVDVRRVRWLPHLEDPVGGARMVPREHAAAVLTDVHDRAGAGRPGWLSRSPAWWGAVLGDVGMYLGGGPSMVVVHHDDRGRADGYAIYRVTPDWSSGSARSRLEVSELVAVDVPARLALWQHVLHHDLVAEVTAWVAPDDPLLDALADPRAVRTTYEGDQCWLRPLDVPRLLEGRTYQGTGTVVLDVRDGLRPHGSGRYVLDVGADGATCGRDAAATADLTLEVAELGALVLGGGSARRAARVGRVHELRAGAAAAVDALFALDPLPWCPTRF